jgi:DNA-directed RNA polymerase alpha subunit
LGGIILTVEKSLRVCEKGHKFYKSSECSSCPTCDKENKPKSGFLSKLSSPARNALVREGIDTLQELAKYTEKEILKMHGIGPASLPFMRASLEEEGLSFKE